MSEEDTLWVAVKLKNLKWHYCMKRLAYELIEEIGVDEETTVEMQPTTEGFIDNPGIIMADRSYQNIKIDTFKLVIPTEDFEYFHGKLKEAPVRRFRGGDEYHKIHGWLACAMFTRDQQEMLVEAMGHILPEVRAAAEEEFLEFNRRLSRIRENGGRVASGKETRFKGRN